MNQHFDKIWLEHLARRERHLDTNYDPWLGIGCSGDRLEVRVDWSDQPILIPVAMTRSSEYSPTLRQTQWEQLRCRYDFEYWCVRCVKIKDKSSARDIPFLLNAPQRRVLALLEDDRLAQRPIRIIMLKARQWGGSTLILIYMAWMQCCLYTNWHSLICAHVKQASANILGMYSKVLAAYPKELWTDEVDPKFAPFERSTNIREIQGRGCRVTVSSSENHDALRGADYAMAHLSEVAFWADTPSKSPEDYVRAVCGAINSVPGTLIVMESTANGVGNYFHSEWMRAKQGLSDKHAVFVPWHEIEIYRAPVDRDQAEELYDQMDPYERALWDDGRDLEQIAWYHNKRREMASQDAFRAEYPSNDIEAFAMSGCNVFSNNHIEALRKECKGPVMKGEVAGAATWGPSALDNVRFKEDRNGSLEIWTLPDPEHDYLVAVDIGGRSAKADWSVIAVLDVTTDRPEVVAQWRGHIDHDLLAWKSAQIATFYADALLVIESNTLESENTADDGSLFILSRLAMHYPNLYHRGEDSRLEGALRPGFHTNRATKQAVIQELIARLREGTYVERSHLACDEMAVYQQLPNGTYGARAGHHDDVLMTRAIALYIASVHPAPPRVNIFDGIIPW